MVKFLYLLETLPSTYGVAFGDVWRTLEPRFLKPRLRAPGILYLGSLGPPSRTASLFAVKEPRFRLLTGFIGYRNFIHLGPGFQFTHHTRAM